MWKFKNSALVLLILAIALAKSQAQISTQDLAIAKSTISPNAEHYSSNKKKKGFFLFWMYKQFISSQDIPNVCRFHPSCSEYGLLQIDKNGLIIGSLATFDRLTRCNGRQNEDVYYYNVDKKRFVDWP